MGNKFPLDLGSFKKSSETNSSAILIHPHGHKIIISKEKLNDRLRKQLASLPMSNDTQKLARGGEITDPDNLRSVAEHEFASYGGNPWEAPRIIDQNPNETGREIMATDGSVILDEAPSELERSPGDGIYGSYLGGPKGSAKVYRPSIDYTDPNRFEASVHNVQKQTLAGNPLVDHVSPTGIILLPKGQDSRENLNTVRHEISHHNFYNNPHYGVFKKYGENQKIPDFKQEGSKFPEPLPAGDPTHGMAPLYKGQNPREVGYFADGGEVNPNHISNAMQSADSWLGEHGFYGAKPQYRAPDTAYLAAAPSAPVPQAPIQQQPRQEAPKPQQPQPAQQPQPRKQQQPNFINTYERAIRGEGEGQIEANRQQALIEQEHINEQQKLHSLYTKNLSDLTMEHSRVVKDYDNGHIDPERYIKSKSTVGRISSAIGLLLGGMGGGLLHEPNPAMKFLNDEINRDIEAQKEDLGKKKNLLSANIAMFGNLNDAIKMSQVNMAGIMASKMKKSALQTSDPIIRNQQLQKIAAFQAQYVPTMNEMALKHSAMEMFNSSPNGVSASMIEALPLEMKERVVALPGGQTALAPTKEDASKAKASLPIFIGINRQLNDIENFMNETGTTYYGSDKSAQAAAMQNRLAVSLKDLFSLGALSASDFDLLNKMTPDPGAFMQDRSRARLKEMQSYINSKYSDAVSMHLPGAKVAPLPGVPIIKMMNGIPHMKVTGGWQKVSR